MYSNTLLSFLQVRVRQFRYGWSKLWATVNTNDCLQNLIALPALVPIGLETLKPGVGWHLFLQHLELQPCHFQWWIFIMICTQLCSQCAQTPCFATPPTQKKERTSNAQLNHTHRQKHYYLNKTGQKPVKSALQGRQFRKGMSTVVIFLANPPRPLIQAGPNYGRCWLPCCKMSMHKELPVLSDGLPHWLYFFHACMKTRDGSKLWSLLLPKDYTQSNRMGREKKSNGGKRKEKKRQKTPTMIVVLFLNKWSDDGNISCDVVKRR